MTERAAIRCKGVSVGYGREEILCNVDFSMSPGELLPVIGPNGGGKTTFLRALLGLIPLQNGVISFGLSEKTLGYVPQHRRIDPIYPVSVRAIVAMGLYPELGFWRRADRRQRMRLDHTLEKFDLYAHRKKTFSELSGGMRQKCLLARAFVSGADLFLLDEPCAGLDAGSEKWFLAHLAKINREEGKTILMVHHRLEDLSSLSRTACLVDRRQVARIPASRAGRSATADPESPPA